MNIENMTRNKRISEFSTMTGVSVTTLRDWNKRGFADAIGQPGPNGHWLYSNWDAAKVKIAEILHGNGINWKVALFAGSVMGSHLEGRACHSADSYYQLNVFVFYGIEPHAKTYWGVGETAEAAANAASINAGPYSILSPVGLLVNLADIAGMLAISRASEFSGTAG